MKSILATALSLSLLTTSCSRDDHGHDHGPGVDHDHAVEADDDHDHEHEEHPLGTITLGDFEVTLAQAHGPIEPGKEAHLVVKLPYTDQGATVVRAWLGTEDRTRSLVGRADYAASHDDYDVHATAPDPLPTDTRWWIELERPDGTRLVGSAVPRLE